MAEDIVTEAEDIASEVIDKAEEFFSPKPGGIVDRHRKEVARRKEAERERENADEPVEQLAYRSIKVTQLSPEIISPAVFSIPAGQYALILPSSPYRYRALVSVTPLAYTALGSSPVNPQVLVMVPPVLNSTDSYFNYTNQPYAVTISGGTISQVKVGGVSVGEGDGTYYVPPGDGIAVTYTVAPTWSWAPVYAPASMNQVILARDSGAALSGNGFAVRESVPAELRTRGQVYAYNPGTVTVQVSVLSEIYAPEEK